MIPPRRFAGDIAEIARRLELGGIPGDETRGDARALVLHALGLDRTRAALRTRPISADEQAMVEPLIARRLARESVAHILGVRWFHGLEFAVDRRVLIPRPETELLVDTSLEHVADRPAPRVLEIGTGSGCIAVALAVRAPSLRIDATDLSPEALDVARANAHLHQVEDRIEFHRGDLYDACPEMGPWDVVVSNPPYIPADQLATLAPEVIRNDPDLALRGPGPDGLDLVRRLVEGALERLVPGGLCAVEIGMGQAEATAACFQNAGFADVAVVPDPAGIGRVVRGTRAGSG
ncbi:MAG: peptide chain release factor N(5)-glutamine methyltransferase [Armatimonadota bacterium]